MVINEAHAAPSGAVDEKKEPVITAEERDYYIRAGKIAAQIIREASGKIVEGAKLLDVASFVDERTVELGALPAFPVNLSINEIAAHYTPGLNDESVFSKGDLVKLDVGVHIEGYPSDTAVTVLVGGGSDGSPESEKKLSMMKAAEEALDAAIKAAGPGVPLSNLGGAIEDAITARGFNPVRNLTGHSMERWVLHSGMNVNNYKGQAGTLEPGMIVAIEPFATDGAGRIIESSKSLIYGITLNSKNVRATQARALLQSLFDSYKTLPFAKRWVEKKHGPNAAFLNQLIFSGALHVYPILKEAAGGLVTQAEHTILIEEKGVTVLSRE